MGLGRPLGPNHRVDFHPAQSSGKSVSRKIDRAYYAPREQPPSDSVRLLDIAFQQSYFFGCQVEQLIDMRIYLGFCLRDSGC